MLSSLRTAAFAAALLLTTAFADAQTLRWSSQGDPLTMDPHSQNEGLTNAINGQVYERLTRRSRQLEIVPSLATEWQQSGPTTWRFKLRPGVKFHDGTPFTADDVVFSYKRASTPPSNLTSCAQGIKDVKKVDDFTIESRCCRKIGLTCGRRNSTVSGSIATGVPSALA